MTTKSGARIYRGVGAKLKDGACPHCYRVIAITSMGRRRAHKDGDMDCPGSRVSVVDEAAASIVIPLPPVVLGHDGSNSRGNKWSGKP